MTEYTPTTDEVRDGFSYNEWDIFQEEEEKPRRQAFDRWLNEIRAEAWDEGYWNGLADGQTGYNVPENPYRPNEK